MGLDPAIDLNPDQQMEIDEPIVVEQGNRVVNGSATKDGIPVSYNLSVYVFLPITVTISGEDLQTSISKFDIVGVQASSFDQLDKFFDDLIKKRLQVQPAPKSWWARLTNHIAPVQGRGLLLMPTFDTVNTPDGYTVFVGKQDMTGGVTEYSFHLR